MYLQAGCELEVYIEMSRGSHQKSHPISGEDAISLQTCEQMRQKLNSGAVKFAQFLPLQLARVCEMRVTKSGANAMIFVVATHTYM